MTQHSTRIRFGGAFVVGAAVAGALATAQDAKALPRTQVAVVGRVETPLGTQGLRGASRTAGGDVVVIFNLIDASRRRTDVDVQYGVDLNGDGQITDGSPDPLTGVATLNEYRTCTEDRQDPRDTRRNAKPQLFTTAGDIGASQAFVWKSVIDVGSQRFSTLEYKLTPQGRLIPDPDNPGSYLFATGPDGQPILTGVKLRVRASRIIGTGRTARRINGPWSYSGQFDLNNNHIPSATVDSIEPNTTSTPTASDEKVRIHWTVYDQDSEDLNGNGVFDIQLGEDLNGNGVFDCEKVGVAFDYHRVAANENPLTMTQAELDATDKVQGYWNACTRATDDGDTDSMVVSPISPPQGGLCSAPPGVGRHYVFTWNSIVDVGTVYAKYILRVRPFDQKREQGAFTYVTNPFQLDNWKIFNDGSANFLVANLETPRVGVTATHSLSLANAGDPLDRGESQFPLPKQNFLVAGGATALGGVGVSSLDLMAANTLTAETSTTVRIPIPDLRPRAWHSAVQLDDGRILFVGGIGAAHETLNTTDVYDPRTRTVVPGPNLAVARSHHAAVKLASGDVAVFGGLGSDGVTPTASAELISVLSYEDLSANPIDPATWTVTALPNMTTAQSDLIAAVMPDQTVIVGAGINAAGQGVANVQILDPLHDNNLADPAKNPAWVGSANMLSTRRYCTATAMLNGSVLFAGGTATVGGPALATMEVYDAATRTFEAVDPTVQMDVGRAQHTAIVLGDGSVLLAGGTSNPDAASPTVLADADVVAVGAPSDGVWSAQKLPVNGDLNVARRLAPACAIDSGRVFVVAGVTGSSNATTSDVECYTPANGTDYAPTARVTPQSNDLSWGYGAPIYYRLTDVEQDRARVTVDFQDKSPIGDGSWHGCSPLAVTIGHDVADPTANLTTTAVDDQALAIDPVARNTPGDHEYIWKMSADIPRPAADLVAGNGPYSLRVLPYGAVRGPAAVTATSIFVHYNTRVVATVLPFENYAAYRPDVTKPNAGDLTDKQGGDIHIWTHLQDVDGTDPNSPYGDVA